jgi:hypothetical protein
LRNRRMITESRRMRSVLRSKPDSFMQKGDLHACAPRW